MPMGANSFPKPIEVESVLDLIEAAAQAVADCARVQHSWHMGDLAAAVTALSETRDKLKTAVDTLTTEAGLDPRDWEALEAPDDEDHPALNKET